jgi:ribosomal protein S18 acetylase RimI-like enzyme
VGPGKPRSSTFPDDWSLIRMLVVDPAYRGQGIAQQLMAACLRCAIRDGAPVVGLHTSPIMATALRLYTRLGFVRDRELDPIHGVPYARYVLPAERVPAALELLSS